MNRTPPLEVRRKIRQDAGFTCVVPGCESPYLEWHHFDPPWSVSQHHDPDGMVGLCPEHHRKADAGAFTVEQLRQYKLAALDVAPDVRGRFDWLREEMVLLAGSVAFIDCKVAVQVNERPVLWFNRDDDGYALLNVRMPRTGRAQRVVIEDNFWIQRGNPKDLVCPPGGKSLEVSYANGDYLRVAFAEVPDAAAMLARYPYITDGVVPPVTAVDVALRTPSLGLAFDTQARIGTNTVSNSVVRNCGVGLSINLRP